MGHWFESNPDYNCNDSEMNDGTDAKNEMETWACPDTNRTDITTLLKNKNYEIRRMENSIPRRKTKVLGK